MQGIGRTGGPPRSGGLPPHTRVADYRQNGIMALLDELRGPKRPLIMKIADRHGVTNICVFGSVARREDSATSDVDFLIEYGRATPPWFPGGLIADLEELLGRKVEVGKAELLHPSIRERAISEAIAI